MLTAAQLSVKVSADTRQAEEGLHNVGRQATNAGTGLKGALENMLQFAGGQFIFQELSNAVGALTGQVKDFLGAGFSFDETMEHLQAQLTAITGSGKTADQMTTWIKKFGQTVPDTTENLARATVTIQSLGLNAEQVMPHLANVAAAMGVDLPSASQAFADAYEGRFQMLQMDLHVTKKQLEAFGLDTKNIQGTLPQAFAAFQKAKFPKGLQAAMGTFQGQVSNLKDRYQMLAGEVMKPVFKGVEKDLLKLFDIMDKNKGTIGKVAGMIGGALGGALSTAVNWILQAGKALGPLIANFNSTHGAGSKLTPIIQQLGNFFMHVVLPAVKQFAGFVMSTVVPAIMKLAEWFGTHVLPIILKVANIIMTDVVPAVEQVAGSILKNLLPPLEHLWNVLSPLIVPILSYLGWILKNVLGPVIGFIIKVIGGLVDLLANILAPIISNIIVPMFNKMSGVLETVFTWVGKLFDIIGKLVGGPLKALGNGIGNALGGVGNALSHLPHFASGGTMPQTGWALVGENGPEIVKLPGATQVYSSPSQVAGAGTPIGMGGGQPIHVSVQIDGRTVARAVAQHLPNVVAYGAGVRGVS